MDFRNMKTKHVQGVCACGQSYEGTVPHFVNVTQCDDCIAKSQQRLSKHERDLQLARSATACGIPNKYRSWDDAMAKKVGNDKLIVWLRNHTTNKLESVWIGGTNGIGKTHASLFMAYELLSLASIHSYCVRSSAWLREVVTERTGNHRSDVKYNKAIESRLLVLDDLGKERLTEPRAELLYDIIDERDRHNRPIWITTNFEGKELMERLNSAGEGGHEYGYAILKRLKRMINADRIWK